jgi:prepilin peptidase CpaA
MSTLQALPLLAFPVLLVVAALRDVVSFTIPNWISTALLLAFPVAAVAVGLPWGEAAQHAAVGGVALLIGMGLFALNWIGGGDAKMMSASALWLGLAGAPSYLLWTALAGGALALVLMAARKARLMLPTPAGTALGRGVAGAQGRCSLRRGVGGGRAARVPTVGAVPGGVLRLLPSRVAGGVGGGRAAAAARARERSRPGFGAAAGVAALARRAHPRPLPSSGRGALGMLARRAHPRRLPSSGRGALRQALIQPAKHLR